MFCITLNKYNSYYGLWPESKHKTSYSSQIEFGRFKRAEYANESSKRNGLVSRTGPRAFRIKETNEITHSKQKGGVVCLEKKKNEKRPSMLRTRRLVVQMLWKTSFLFFL